MEGARAFVCMGMCEDLCGLTTSQQTAELTWIAVLHLLSSDLKQDRQPYEVPNSNPGYTTVT